jgi:hypothetical protein
LAKNIKVVHSSELPSVEKKEVQNRQKIRSLLTTNHVKSIEPTQATIDQPIQIENFSLLDDKPNDFLFDSGPVYQSNFPNARKLLSMIKSEFLEERYIFNIANLPVTTRYSNHNSKRLDNKYEKYIKNSISEWNELFNNSDMSNNILSIKKIKLLFIKETENEFVVIGNVQLLYQNKTLHLQITYYGKINKNDDFINDGIDTCSLQLVNIKPISKTEFDNSTHSLNKRNSILESHSGPFISMEEQMAYVNRINKMHQNEQ